MTARTIVVEPDPRARTPGKPGRRRPMHVDTVGGVEIRRPVGYKRRVGELATRSKIHERRRKAFQLLVGRYDCHKIGLFLHADPSVCTNDDVNENGSGTGTLGGYGWQNYRDGKPPLIGEALRVTVSRDLKRGFEQSAKYEQHSLDDARQLELESLNTMFSSIWPKVLKGQLGAIDRAIVISERRSKLLGLDAPERTETTIDATVTVVGAQPELNEEYAGKMFAALAEIGAVDEAPPVPELPVSTGPHGAVVDTTAVTDDDAVTA